MKLQELIAALGSQVRWNVFEFVAGNGPATGDQIAAGLETKRHNVTRALTELARYGLLDRRVAGTGYGAGHDAGRTAFLYSATPAVKDWLARTRLTFKGLVDGEE